MLWGTGLGLICAYSLSRVVSHAVPGLPVNDPLVFGGVTLILIAIGLLACWLPARRASRIDFTVALRAE